MVRILITMLAVFGLVGCGFQKAPAPRSENADGSFARGGLPAGEADAGETRALCTREGGCPDDLPYCSQENFCVQCLQDGACDEANPRCEMTRNECVQCLADMDCIDPTAAFCDEASHRCKQCRTTLDCTEPDSPRCDEGKCGECKADNDCDHVEGHPVCNLSDSKTRGQCVECNAHTDCKDPQKPQCTDHACTPCKGKNADDACEAHTGAQLCNTMPGKNQGTCVQCTVSNESACGDFVCDARKNSCTKQRRGMTGICLPCVADSQCTTDHRCVELEYNGKKHGSYCLKREYLGCVEPFTIQVTAPSIAGAPEEEYCGINTKSTTCESVVDAIKSKMCDDAKDCGVGMGDGACGRVGGQDNRCTYACGISAHCPVAVDCNTDTRLCQ